MDLLRLETSILLRRNFLTERKPTGKKRFKLRYCTLLQGTFYFSCFHVFCYILIYIFSFVNFTDSLQDLDTVYLLLVLRCFYIRTNN
jgi:hypothetical protein